MQVKTELFGDVYNKKRRKLYVGRHDFLEKHGAIMINEPNALIHAVSYSIDPEPPAKKQEILEIYPDQIWRAAAHHFPDEPIAPFIQMLTEELLAQFCIADWKRSLHKDPRIHQLLSMSVVDEFISGVMKKKSFSKIMRDRSAHRLEGLLFKEVGFLVSR